MSGVVLSILLSSAWIAWLVHVALLLHALSRAVNISNKHIHHAAAAAADDDDHARQADRFYMHLARSMECFSKPTHHDNASLMF